MTALPCLSSFALLLWKLSCVVVNVFTDEANSLRAFILLKRETLNGRRKLIPHRQLSKFGPMFILVTIKTTPRHVSVCNLECVYSKLPRKTGSQQLCVFETR